MKYQRRCPRCGKMRDDWKFNSVEEGVWIKSICDDCLEISPSIPIIKEESEEHRVETDAKDSSPLPQEVAVNTDATAPSETEAGAEGEAEGDSLSLSQLNLFKGD